MRYDQLNPSELAQLARDTLAYVWRVKHTLATVRETKVLAPYSDKLQRQKAADAVVELERATRMMLALLDGDGHAAEVLPPDLTLLDIVQAGELVPDNAPIPPLPPAVPTVTFAGRGFYVPSVRALPYAESITVEVECLTHPEQWAALSINRAQLDEWMTRMNDVRETSKLFD